MMPSSVDSLQPVQTAETNPGEISEDREQPWKKLVGVVDEDSKLQSGEEDLFPAQDGFHSHTVAA